MSITPWRFRFARLDSPEEGERIHRVTGKRKADYLGQVCRQVTKAAPYGMEFTDGAIWALDAGQLELIGGGSYKSEGPSTDRYRKPVRCIETGELFLSQSLAAKWVGSRAEYVKASCDTGRSVKGYHFERVEDDEE